MIAKTTTGSDFGGGIAYGAGIRSGRENKQSRLVSVSNIYSTDAESIASEMRNVAALNDRIQRPVWHTALAWAPGEVVSLEQKRQAAALYCELIGASLERHQVVVYEHRDKPHPHIHIYINRVPLDGGPALALHNNYARNVKATAHIREKLGMTPLPEKRQSLRDHSPDKQATRELVQGAVQRALGDQQVTTTEQLQQQLRGQGIETRLKVNEQGTLVGVSFRAGGISVTGTEVGYKAHQLRTHFAGLAGAPAPRVAARPQREPDPGTPARPAHPRATDAQQQQVRQDVHNALTAALQRPDVRTVADLAKQLGTAGIAATFKRDQQGVLVGTRFRYQEQEVKGTEVGYKAQQLRAHFLNEPQVGIRTGGQPTPLPQIDREGTAGPAGDDSVGLVGLVGQLTAALGQGLQPTQAGDEARDQENEPRKRRRRRPML